MLAHVPDLNDFVAGMAIAARPHGVVTVEFPHLVRLIEGNQFDTIYHEHFSYFSFWHGPSSLRSARLRCSTSRSCRPTAARCGSGRTTGGRGQSARSSDRVAELAASEQDRRLETARRLRGFGAARGQDQVEAARVPDRLPPWR